MVKNSQRARHESLIGTTSNNLFHANQIGTQEMSPTPMLWSFQVPYPTPSLSSLMHNVCKKNYCRFT